MPKPLVPPSQEGPQKVGPTPEQVAKAVTAKLKSPVAQPDKAEITLRLVLPRGPLMARASREAYPSLAALVHAVLEREGADWAIREARPLEALLENSGRGRRLAASAAA